jgi:hypothetical protein
MHKFSTLEVRRRMAGGSGCELSRTNETMTITIRRPEVCH